MPQIEMTETITTKGELPITPAQSSYLKSLSKLANVEFKSDLTKVAASRRIDELRDRLRG